MAIKDLHVDFHIKKFKNKYANAYMLQMKIL